MASSSASGNPSPNNNNNNNNNKNGGRSHHPEDLDSFLTTIESKLRGPFSSLDLAKAVSTAALKSSNKQAGAAAARAYLQNLSQVLGRSDKVIQCRMLIGLLGLADAAADGFNEDRETSLTSEIVHILRETQADKLHDEWVRTTSGLVQGIMFRPARCGATNDDGGGRSDLRPCRGDEAARTVETTAEADVTDHVEREIRREVVSATQQDRSGGGALLCTPDLNACFAPYRYRLISPHVLAAILPELRRQTVGPVAPGPDGGTAADEGEQHTNCHFRVASKPGILQIDEQLEEQRAREAHQHEFGAAAAGVVGGDRRGSGSGTTPAGAAAPTSTPADAATTTTAAAFPPGFRRTQLVRTVGDSTGRTGGGSSSMFMPKGRAGGAATAAAAAAAASGGVVPSTTPFNTSTKYRPAVAKAPLRKRGGAQALVSRSTMRGRAAAGVVQAATGGGDGGSAASANDGTSPAAAAAAAASDSVTASTSSSRPALLSSSSSHPPPPSSTSLADRLAARKAEGRSYGGRGGGGASTALKGRSKMVMIDVEEAGSLQQQRQQQQQHAAEQVDPQTARLSKKRRIMEMAKQKAGLTTSTATTAAAAAPGHNVALPSPNKKSKISQLPPTETRQPHHAGIRGSAPSPPSPPPSPDEHANDGWESMLGGRSNKISDEDRVRLQQFFENRTYNPIPDQPNVYKMKVHEQRGEDPETRQPIKETFYLELDYDEGKFQQLRKVKRY